MESTQPREHMCTGGVRRVYPGGVYHSTPSVFERLDDENIRVAEALRYYPYRATFDFECWFDTEHLPSDSDQVHWVARHFVKVVELWECEWKEMRRTPAVRKCLDAAFPRRRSTCGGR